ncbi:MAG: hypothetical protein JO295_05550 [Verrucomicrobia bacterium]|nr:hypothetical protein [Verrucomicrobiota bacterium]
MTPSPTQPSSLSPRVSADDAAPDLAAQASDARPRSLARRLGLLAVLFLLPVLAVSLPVLLIGQRPPPGQGASAWAGFGALRAWWRGGSSTPASQSQNAAPGFDNLRESLNKSAQAQLPDSSASLTSPGEITIPATDDAANIDAQFAALTRLAERLGGSAAEKPADAAGRHLFVTLPAAGGSSERAAFETLATRHLDLLVNAADGAELDKLIAVATPNSSPAAVAPSSPATPDARDFLTVSVAAASTASSPSPRP